ncbi:hypothetical protein DL93DRAFT_2078828 [Clavulina sp. PMI_390]|nr:hypothetical protein DL93DRAFT_2078828 [Clavulina sp. PMI_390]
MPPRSPPAVCNWPDCGKEYATKRDLQRHQLSHGAPQFGCNTPGCDRKFYRRDALLRHQRNKTCARRLARRGDGEVDEDLEEPSPPASHIQAPEPPARRPVRTDSVDSSSSSSRGVPIPYHHTLPPLHTSSTGREVTDYDDDEEEEDEFEQHLSRGPSSPVRTSHFSRSHRTSGPYDVPSYSSYGSSSQSRSPIPSRQTYGYSPSNYAPNPLTTSFYDPTNPIYVAASLQEHPIYGNMSNARGATGGDDLEDEY